MDVFGGLRYWDVDTKLAFASGLGALEGLSVQNSEFWVDPLVGIKARMRLGASRFFLAGFLGGGGGASSGSDNFYDMSVTSGPAPSAPRWVIASSMWITTTVRSFTT